MDQRDGFVARQFALERTNAQDLFDGLFGVFLPVLCFLADPLIFTGIYRDYQLLAYTFSGIQIAMLMTWRTFGRHLTWLAAPMAGVFIAGGLFSTTIGIFILPFSLIGMLMIIGLAGFTPFVTAFVYLRAGIRALETHNKTSFFKSPVTLAIPAGILAIAIPVIVSNEMTRLVSVSVNEVVYGDEERAELAANRLKWVPLISEGELRRVVTAHHAELDPAKREALSRHYKEITGRDIEDEHQFD